MKQQCEAGARREAALLLNLVFWLAIYGGAAIGVLVVEPKVAQVILEGVQGLSLLMLLGIAAKIGACD